MLDPNLSNAHGQITALIAAMRAFLDAYHAAKPIVALRLEQITASLLSTPADQHFLEGFEYVKKALLLERKEPPTG
jgi:hypothetical protein